MTKKKAIKEFLIGLILLTGLLAGLVWVLAFSYEFDLPSVTPAIFTFLFTSTMLVHGAYIFGSEVGGQTSISLLMGTVFGKLIFNIFFIIILIYFNPEESFSITLLYFGLFILYTTYEIVLITWFINSGRA